MKIGEKRFLGKHLDCGGDVYYIKASSSFCFRRCELCKQDGMRGTMSPRIEDEQ